MQLAIVKPLRPRSIWSLRPSERQWIYQESDAVSLVSTVDGRIQVTSTTNTGEVSNAMERLMTYPDDQEIPSYVFSVATKPCRLDFMDRFAKVST